MYSPYNTSKSKVVADLVEDHKDLQLIEVPLNDQDLLGMPGGSVIFSDALYTSIFKKK